MLAVPAQLLPTHITSRRPVGAEGAAAAAVAVLGIASGRAVTLAAVAAAARRRRVREGVRIT
ncbi:hypothetical protein GCM10022237_18310 [Nocardioides ginsengisoli]